MVGGTLLERGLICSVLSQGWRKSHQRVIELSGPTPWWIARTLGHSGFGPPPAPEPWLSQRARQTPGQTLTAAGPLQKSHLPRPCRSPWIAASPLSPTRSLGLRILLSKSLAPRRSSPAARFCIAGQSLNRGHPPACSSPLPCFRPATLPPTLRVAIRARIIRWS